MSADARFGVVSSEPEPESGQADCRAHDRVRQCHLEHLPVPEADFRGQRGREEEQESRLTVRRRDARDVRPGVDRDRQLLELHGIDQPHLVRLLRRVDEDRGDEDVVRDRAEAAAGTVEGHLLAFLLEAQRPHHDRVEEPLILDHGHDHEEGDQQSTEGEGRRERLADVVFLVDPSEDGREDDQAQPEDADRRDVRCEADHQEQRRRTLHPEFELDGEGAVRLVLGRIGLQHGSDVARHESAVSEQGADHPDLLEYDSGQQADDQGREGDDPHVLDEPHVLPVLCVLGGERRAHGRCDQEVLGLTGGRHHASQHAPDREMHRKGAEKGPKLRQLLVVSVVAVALLAAVGHVHVVHRDHVGEHHRHDREGVEVGAEHHPRERETDGEHDFVFDLDHHRAEDHGQPVAQEMHAGDHEHQQEDDLEVVVCLLVHGVRIRHVHDDGLNGQESAGEQGVALEGAGQEDDELADHEPAHDELRVRREQEEGVDEEEGENELLVPAARVPEEDAEGHSAQRLGFRIHFLFQPFSFR